MTEMCVATLSRQKIQQCLKHSKLQLRSNIRLAGIRRFCQSQASEIQSYRYWNSLRITKPQQLIVWKEALIEAMHNRHSSMHAFRDIPKVHYVFKFLSAHGILQFTMLIALRCTLHRCSNRNIHHWKLLVFQSNCNLEHAKWINFKVETMVTRSFEFQLVKSTIREYLQEALAWVSPSELYTKIEYIILIMCEWSFRRFTYGNLVTTSPSSKW